MSLHVLVPMDGSPLSEKALAHVLREHPGADVTVLHVIDPMEAIYAAESGGPTFAEEWVDAAEDRGERIGVEARELAEEYGTNLTYTIETGKPARVILDVAAERDVDHVVMGSHGRTGVSRVLLGSVAEHVLRRSPVPVTIVR